MARNASENRVLVYGEHPDQHVVLTCAHGQQAPGTAILIHGGYWRQRITADVMLPLANDLLKAGWNVANVEYRRGSEHPWPLPSADVANAIQLVRSTLRHQHENDATVLVGHSVGGQLALLNGDFADAVVALAPVTDVALIHDGDFGDSAAEEYFGTSPSESPALYQQASPSHSKFPRVPLLIVHGENDDRVPVGHTRGYVRALEESTQPATRFHPSLDHFEIIDPRQHHWEATREWMNQVLLGISAK